MSFWDDISDKIGEVSFEDVIGVFGAADSVGDQGKEVASQQGAKRESYVQPVHGTTADGRPLLASNGQQLPAPWYNDPFKLMGAVSGVALVFLLAIKVAK